MNKYKLPSKSADIWVVKVPSKIPDNLVQLLDINELERYKRCSNKIVAQTFLTSRASLKILLKEYLQIPIKNIEISTEPGGKPVLKNNANLHFNISHSNKIILISFSDKPNGIDVEKIEKRKNSEQIVRRFFSQNEINSWQQALINNPETAFLTGWTRKEAFVKATGDGLSGLSKVQVSFATNTTSKILFLQKFFDKGFEWHIHDFFPEEGYMGCIVCCQKNPQINIRKFFF